jgi:hypothetical protein
VAEPQPKELKELNGLNKLPEAKEFARVAQIPTDSNRWARLKAIPADFTHLSKSLPESNFC